METSPCANCKKIKGYKKVSKRKNGKILHFYSPNLYFPLIRPGFSPESMYKPIVYIHKTQFQGNL